MSRHVCVIQWTDKAGIIHRTAPVAVDGATDEWMKAGARQAFEAMCKPELLELVETDDGYLMEP